MGEYNFCDYFPPAIPSRSFLEGLESEMALCASVARGHHKSSGESSLLGFYASFLSAYRPGVPVRVGGAYVPPEDASSIMRIKDIEAEILPCFSRMLEGILLKQASISGKDPAELHADVYSSFVNAMLNYNGETRFSTYLTSAVSRNLARKAADEGLVRTPARIRRLTMRVVDSMRRDRKSFDSAVESCGLSEKESKVVALSMRKVRNTTELEIKDSEMAVSPESKPDGWVENLIDHAKLGGLERAVVHAFLASPPGSMGLCRGCRGMLNPKTGKPYSRAAISSAWRQARKKLAVVLEDAA